MNSSRQHDPGVHGLPQVRRRTVLLGGVAVGIAGALVGPQVAVPQAAQANPAPSPNLAVGDQQQADRAQQRVNAIFPGWSSANGWLVQSKVDPAGLIFTTPFYGLSATAELHCGAPAAILGWVVEEFNRSVAPIRGETLTGFKNAAQNDPGPATNHASGTAVDIMPAMFPDGVLDTLTGLQRKAIQTILDTVAPAVTWGGGFTTPQHSHFEIALGPTDTRLVAACAKAGRPLTGTA